MSKRTAEPCRGRPQNDPPAKSAGGSLCLAKKPAPVSSVYEFAGASATAAGPITLEDQTPRRKFVKDLIRVGEYVNGGEQIAITAADIDRWAKAGNDFIAAGNDVPIPDGHTDDATANRGYAREFYRDGDTLFAIVEMIGEDGIATAARSKVSIKTDVDYVDGKGNRYPNLITHIALTNAPVVPDQNGFVPIAASRGGKPTRARLFRLALSTENSMEHLTKIATMLGIPVDGLDEAALCAAICKSVESMQGMSKTAKEGEAAAKTELASVKASLSKAPPEPPAALVRMAAENRTLKLSQLVKDGKITPAVRDDLAGIWIGTDNAGLKLSLDDKGDGQFAALCEALAKNDPIKLGEHTKAAGVSLSRVQDAPKFDAAKAAADLMGTIGIKAK